MDLLPVGDYVNKQLLANMSEMIDKDPTAAEKFDAINKSMSSPGGTAVYLLQFVSRKSVSIVRKITGKKGRDRLKSLY